MPATQSSPPLFLGDFRALEVALAKEIASHKAACDPLAPVRVLVPTHLLGLHLQRTLTRAPQLDGGHFNLRFSTLESFANELTAASALRIAPPLALELLCGRIARDVIPQNGYFASIRESAGFHAALLATFTDLKEAVILPAAFHRGAKTQKLKELAAAYEEFCTWLEKHGWHTEADLLEQSQISSLQSQTFLYGFYDLNTVQKKFIETIKPTSVFFPFADKHFDYAQPLLNWFQRNGYSIAHAPSLSSSHTPMIISAAGETSEVREAIREAFAFAHEQGKVFNDIAILSRSREPYDSILRDILGNLDIPAYFRGGRPLIEHRDAKLLLLLLEAIQTDFGRAAVMELVCYVGDHADWDALSVELGIVKGREQWLKRVKTATNSPREGGERASAHQLWRLKTAQALLPFLENFFTSACQVPQQGKWAELAERVLAAWAALGGKDDRVRGAVRALANLDEFASPVEFTQFSEFVKLALSNERKQVEKFQGGGLFVSDVMGVRGLSFPLVIVLGLVEKNFPRAVREDPLLLDTERALISADLPMKQRGYKEEHLLFELAQASAMEKLVLSFPRIESGTARPRAPSHFLLEVAQVTDSKDLEKLPNFRAAPLGQPNHGEAALDEREYDIGLLGSVPRAPRSLVKTMSFCLAAGLEAHQQRWGKKALTAYDGVVVGARAPLDTMEVSPSRLELLAHCPFKYFCKHTLGLKEWEGHESTWSAESDDLGKLVHDILREVFEGWKANGLLPLLPAQRADLQADLRRLAGAKLNQFEGEKVTGLPVVWDWQRRTILRDLDRFLEEELKGADARFLPTEFEHPFPSVVLAIGKELSLKLRGRLDRLDVDAAGKQMRIYDYKTGRYYSDRYKEDALVGGEALQLPLYALAMAQDLGLQLDSALYVFLAAHGEYRRVQFSGKALAVRMPDVERVLATLAALLGEGIFAQYTEGNRCDRCEFRPICGVAIPALAERKQDDNRFAEFMAMKREVE